MRAFLCHFALLLVLPACAGGASTVSEPKSSGVPTSSSGDRAESDDAASESPSSSENAAAPAPPAGPSCDDGTCSVCGNGICPRGWYCDEKLGACSWLTACAEKPTCSCVTRVLGSTCKCREEGSGLKVTCD